MEREEPQVFVPMEFNDLAAASVEFSRLIFRIPGVFEVLRITHATSLQHKVVTMGITLIPHNPGYIEIRGLPFGFEFELSRTTASVVFKQPNGTFTTWRATVDVPAPLSFWLACRELFAALAELNEGVLPDLIRKGLQCPAPRSRHLAIRCLVASLVLYRASLYPHTRQSRHRVKSCTL